MINFIEKTESNNKLEIENGQTTTKEEIETTDAVKEETKKVENIL